MYCSDRNRLRQAEEAIRSTLILHWPLSIAVCFCWVHHHWLRGVGFESVAVPVGDSVVLVVASCFLLKGSCSGSRPRCTRSKRSAAPSAACTCLFERKVMMMRLYSALCLGHASSRWPAAQLFLGSSDWTWWDLFVGSSERIWWRWCSSLSSCL